MHLSYTHRFVLIDGFDLGPCAHTCEIPHKYKKYINKELLDIKFSEYLKEGKAKKITGSTSNLYFM